MRLFPTLALIACSSEKVLIDVREPPGIIIEQPIDGSEVYEDTDVYFIAQVQIFDGSPVEDFSYYWVSGGDTICPSATLESTYTASCTYSFPDPGEQSIKVVLNQNGIFAQEAVVDLNVIYNEAPKITILAPTEGSSFPDNSLIEFIAEVEDLETESSELFVSIESSIDGDLNLSDYATSSGEFTVATQLSEGEHYITMRVVDSSNASDEDSIIISVDPPLPPSISSVSYAPPNPVTLDTITAIPQGWNDGNSSEQYRFAWYQLDENNALILDPTETTDSYPSSKTNKGDRLQVEVTPLAIISVYRPIH